MRYKIEVTQLAPNPKAISLECERPADVLPMLFLQDDAEAIVMVSAIERNVDYGNFIILLNRSNRAWVRLLEHREFNPRDTATDVVDDLVYFRDEDEDVFSVKCSETLTRERALAALTYWLPEQRQDPGLIWE